MVGRAGGAPHAELLDRPIFRPLGMRHTWAGPGDGRPEERAAGPVRSLDLANLSRGAGEIGSTTGDVVNGNAAVLAGRLLGPASAEAMLRPHALTAWSHPPLAGLRYGYGWSLTAHRGHRPFLRPATTTASPASTPSCRAMASRWSRPNDQAVEPLPVAVRLARAAC